MLALIAALDFEGTALFTDLLLFFAMTAFFSQAPGPVCSTVLIPERKSGMPQAVEMPAPVKNIPFLEDFIKSANSLHFYSNTSGGSKYSFFSLSVLCAVSIFTYSLYF
jgi:hypothetical protein